MLQYNKNRRLNRDVLLISNRSDDGTEHHTGAIASYKQSLNVACRQPVAVIQRIYVWTL